jgi:hypothetical protein
VTKGFFSSSFNFPLLREDVSYYVTCRPHFHCAMTDFGVLPLVNVSCCGQALFFVSLSFLPYSNKNRKNLKSDIRQYMKIETLEGKLV